MMSLRERRQPSAPALNSLFLDLPVELVQQIRSHVKVMDSPDITQTISIEPLKDPSVPPMDGSCPFLALPIELRREIFSRFLPDKNKVIEPYPAESKPSSGSAGVITFNDLMAMLSSETVTSEPSFSPDRQPPPTVCDILVLNKQICDEILVTLYEERFFCVNVYEGIFSGGISFLNSGLQRLQYQQNFSQVRFKRFSGANDPFGFSRVKHLVIKVFPSKDREQENKTTRHDSMHTHFMLRALVSLLQRKDGSFGLNHLQVQFVEPSSHEWRPRPWQNSTSFQPRSTSIHGVSNIEVILRGLMDIRNVYTAELHLPPGLLRDEKLSDFADRFHSIITGAVSDNNFDNDNLSCQIEGAKDMLDDWLHQLHEGTIANPLREKVEFEDFWGDEFDCMDEEDWTEAPRSSFDAFMDRAKATPTLRNTYEIRSKTAANTAQHYTNTASTSAILASPPTDTASLSNTTDSEPIEIPVPIAAPAPAAVANPLPVLLTPAPQPSPTGIPAFNLMMHPPAMPLW